MNFTIFESGVPDERIQETVFLIEANSFEYHVLWKMHHGDLLWDGANTLVIVNIGAFADEMIRIGINFVRLSGFLVGFYSPIGQVIHLGMIKTWWEMNYPDLKKCDAFNFHVCIDHLQQLFEKEHV